MVRRLGRPAVDDPADHALGGDLLRELLLQRLLDEPRWRESLTDIDRRALTPLFWSNVNPYGRFRLDMDRHLDLELAPTGLPGGPPRAPG